MFSFSLFHFSARCCTGRKVQNDAWAGSFGAVCSTRLPLLPAVWYSTWNLSQSCSVKMRQSVQRPRSALTAHLTPVKPPGVFFFSFVIELLYYFAPCGSSSTNGFESSADSKDGLDKRQRAFCRHTSTNTCGQAVLPTQPLIFPAFTPCEKVPLLLVFFFFSCCFYNILLPFYFVVSQCAAAPQ